MLKIQKIRGVKDLLPQELDKWNYVKSILQSVLNQRNYKEIQLPIIESRELFFKGVGRETDILTKETYDFKDRNGKDLTLRPEGTAGCVRAMLESGLLKNNQKLWYIGPMFRYERPQKGRHREFNQLGVEIYGSFKHIFYEADLINLSWVFFKRLGLENHINLEINNLGDFLERTSYQKALLSYLKPLVNKLDMDSVKQIDKNPLRILDSKNEITQKIISNAPRLEEFIQKDNKTRFKELLDYLLSLNIPVKVNPFLVRGLDYYSHTVFEWKSSDIGTQSTICAGGRYDSLLQRLGDRSSTSAIGFAIGLERLILTLNSKELFPNLDKVIDIFFLTDKSSAFASMKIVEDIRIIFSKKIIDLNVANKSIKHQLKKIINYNIDLLVIISKELESGFCEIRFLRSNKEKIIISLNDIEYFLKSYY